ncbi:MAG: suppressor of fused domain protein [Enterocloster bolteae]
MVVPAYREEIEYKLEYGMEALDKRFSEGNLPMVLDIHRPNYCADFRAG